MASRKRALRTLRSRPQRRSLPPLLDALEARLLLSLPGVTVPKLIFGPMPPSLGSSSGSGPQSSPPSPPKPSALLPIVIKEVTGPDGALLPDQTAGPEGYSPQQIQQAYGVNLVTYGAVKGDGAGQTIAVIDAFDNPGFVDSTAPNFKTSALGVFDSTFGLPDPPSFMKFNQNGGAALPPANSGWGPEIALDVEWAHAMAPEANIDLVEANNSSNNLSDLLLAAKTAATTLGASVVSMSFGENFESAGGGAIELAADANFFAPALAANPHVTFLASSGDNGAAPGVAPAFRIAPIYPSISPLVVAVGGTTLNLTANNQWASETGWSYNSDLFNPAGAGGGGISNTYPAPAYQTNNGVNIGGGNRTVPDVSSDADPNTGASVYDPFDFGPSTGWITVGGTSLSSPTWAGLIAIADQGRVLAGSTALNGPNQTLPELYSLQNYGTFFHDITQGNNGFSAGPGYDLVTGIGTPRANNLLPGLSAFGLATQGTITVQPPTSVIAGGLFGTIVAAEDSAGAPDPSVNGTATISLANGPAGASFTPVTVPVNFGVAVFDGLSLSQLSAGTDYTFHIALSAFPAQSLTTTPVDVASPAAPGVGVYYPLPIDSSLRNDLTAADSNADTANDLFLVYPNTYELTNGQLLLQNTTNLPNKAISIIGQDQTSANTPLINANQASRVFDIVGTRALVTNLSVLFQGIGIEGGLGADDGGLGLAGSPAVGGGVLIDGGVVTMSDVTVKSNEVAGAKGQHGATGASRPVATAYPGGPGTAGGSAEGGGIFLAGGSLTLTGDTITGNTAQGGVGGTGGTGGLAGTITAQRLFYTPKPVVGGVGGAGGEGGSGQGGGLFVNGGTVSITSGSMSGNLARGGVGGIGGRGGLGGATTKSLLAGGLGGVGGVGGQGKGAGIYVAQGNVSVSSAQISGNSGVGGVGGLGGSGASGALASTSHGGTITGPAGGGGAGGKGGNAWGGGVYVGGGVVTLNSGSVDSNLAQSGTGGAGGTGGSGSPSGAPGAGGAAGAGFGGGLFNFGQVGLTNVSLASDGASLGGAIYSDSSLNLFDSTFTTDSADSGGAVYNDLSGTLTVNGSTFTGDTAAGSGGAIDSSGTLTVANGSTFTSDTATVTGGAICVAAGQANISNSTFTGNSAQAGGGIEDAGTLTVFSAGLSGNTASANDGGGIDVHTGGTLTIENSTVTGNSASAGGGISNHDQLTVIATTVSGNSASRLGGGILNVGTATITTSTVEDNTAPGTAAGVGGGVYNASGSMSVSGGTIAANSAGNGGGIFVAKGAVTLSGTSVTGNSATAPTGSGGGIFNQMGTVALSSASLTGNTAASGGGIDNQSGATLTVTESTISNNTATLDVGGGIDNETGGIVTVTSSTLAANSAPLGGGISNSGTATVTSSTLASNSAQDGGGIDNFGTLTVLSSTFSGNSAHLSSGGGISDSGRATVTNSTLASNSATAGGGIFVGNSATLTVTNSTIAYNEVTGSPGSGGGLLTNGGTVTLNNTIVALNSDGAGLGAPADDIARSGGGNVLASSSSNLIGTGGSGGLIGGSNGNQVAVANPRLGALANNGGPTETIALLAGSPAINAGNNAVAVNANHVPLATDQRGPGFPRIVSGTVDIGAFERPAVTNAATVYTVDLTSATGAFTGPDAGDLVYCVDQADTNTNLGGSLIVFDPTVFATPQTIALTSTLVLNPPSGPIVIEGPGAALVTVSGGHAVGVFQVGIDVAANLSGMTISGGKAADGGGILNESAGTLTVANSTISGSSATSGGGIYNDGFLTLTGDTLSSNSATSGGGIYNAGIVTVTGSAFTTNAATNNGGGIDNSGTLTVTSTQFGGSTPADGNTASFGGGIANQAASTLTVTNSSFSNNSAGNNGGAIDNLGTLTVTLGSLADNSAGSGGGIDNEAAGTAIVFDSLFAANSAVDSGGGIENDGRLTAANTTFSGNSAAGGGGLFSQGTLTLVNDTVAYNNATAGGTGGGLDVFAGTTLDNTIVALNTIGAGLGATASDIAGTVSATSTSNLIGDAASSGGLTNGANGNHVGVAPGLASGLASNGGPLETVALLQGSPAIDGGNNAVAINPISGQALTTDARGGVRGPTGINAGAKVDIGAYEATSSYLVTSTADSPDLGTLRTAVGWANVSFNDNQANIANPAPNTVVFNTAGVFGTAQTITLTSGTLALAGAGTPAVAEAIDGDGASELTISGNNGARVFSVASGQTATISGLTITGGSAANGAGIDNFGALTVNNATIANNIATNNGGGIDNEALAELTVSGSTLAGNSTANDGGGIDNAGTLIVTGSTLSTNSAAAGGGVDNESGGTLTVTGGSFTGNTATSGAGGGIDSAGLLSVTNATLSGNKANSHGGGIDSAGTLTLTGSTLSTNAAAVGAGIANESGGTLTVTGSTFTTNAATGNGGGIDNLGLLTITSSTLSGNSAASGGGIDNQSSNALAVTGSSIFSNKATAGGGGIASTGPLTVTNSSFTGNSATSQGGGINAAGPLTVTNSTFSNNSTTSAGGGIDSAGSLTVTNSTFTTNSAAAGGGIDSAGTATVANSVLSANSAIGGGGGIASAGSLTVTNSTLSTNSATSDGGGIDNSGTLSIILSTLSTNSAASGGGVSNEPTGNMTVLESTIANNSATGGGGGLDNAAGGTLRVTNSTIADNSAAQGGGILDAGTLTVVNATIASNSATGFNSGGGLDVIGTGAATLSNAIVALNTFGTGKGATPSDIAGTVAAVSSFNLIGDAGSAGGLTSGTDNNQVGVPNASATLGPLTNNGGPTKTIALLQGSTAIDAGSVALALDAGGNPLTTDQRGALRGPAGLDAGPTVDIGAYEATSSYLVISNADTQALGTLRTALVWASASTNANPANVAKPVPNTIVFDTTGVFAQPQTITLTGGTLVLASTIAPVAIDGPTTSALTISGNDAVGVFSIANGATATLSNLTISGGSAISGGGILNAGTLTVTNATLAGNTGTSSGGGIENTGTLTVTDTTLTGNSAPAGGAIDNAGTLTLVGTTVGTALSGNQAATGAGIDNQAGGTMSVNSSTFTANAAIANGGGIDSAGTLTTTNSTFTGDTAGGVGGGIAIEAGGAATLTNTTVAGNSAASGGGISAAGALTTINTTIAYNNAAATGGAGGGLNVGATGGASLYNTIVALNTIGTGVNPKPSDIAGTVILTSSFNLIGDAKSSGGLTSGVNHNQVGVPSAVLTLGTLANNGGDTETISLLQGSTAIDAGSASIAGVTVPRLDQRGALRGPAGLNAGPAVDIGAYEASSSYLVSTSQDLSVAGSLRAGILWADFSTNANPANLAKPAPNTVVFDSAGVFAQPQTITLTGGTLVLHPGRNSPVAIDGPGANALSISGNNTVGVFSIAAGVMATLSDLTITGGSAADGGGINNFGNLTLSSVAITNNSAGFGGGIDNEVSGTLTVLNATLADNSASNDGGGIENSGGAFATITNTTLAGNSAVLGGGISNAGTLTAVNATIAYNTATDLRSAGGLDVSPGATTTLYNTIVALNTVGTGVGAVPGDIAGSVSANSMFNLIGNAASAGGLANGVHGNLVGLAPDLAPAPGLANNGGPTQTIALEHGSPALNTGAARIAGVAVPTTDQRGVMRNPARLNNGTTIDIGAYEASSTFLVTSAVDSLTSGTLRTAIEWANNNQASAASPGANTILFDTTGVFATPQTITVGSGTLDLTNTGTPETIDGPGASLVTISGGGAVGVFSVATGVSASVTGVTITAGSSASGGGIDNAGTLAVTNDVFTNDGAVYYGGGIYNNGGTLSVANTTFSNDLATYGLGAGIDNSGTLTVTNSMFTGGTAFQGGAIDNKGGTLSVSNSSFLNNSAVEGGGIFNNAKATVTGSTISNNASVSTPTSPTPPPGVVNMNSSSFDGGAIANDLAGILTLINSTLAGNSAGQNGGAIDTVGILTAINDTIAYNSVAPGGSGGGVAAPSGTTIFDNTIIAQNTIGTGKTASPSDVAGNVSLLSAYNLIGTGAGGLQSGTNGNQVGVVNPGLGKLANYGGTTQTIDLLPGSPAIGAGSNALAVDAGGNPLTTDQRGVSYPRIVSTLVDIGAFEAGTTSVYTVNLTSDTGARSGTDATTGTPSGDLLWAITQANANQNTLGSIIKFDPTVFNASSPQTITLTGILALTQTAGPEVINGPGANAVTISGGHATGVFQVGIGVTASMSGLTISGAAANDTNLAGSQGGGIDNSGNLTLTSMAVTNNAGADGAGITNEAGATLTVSGSTLSGNTATTSGGGIYNVGTLTTTNTTIAGNTATLGGGIFELGTLTAVNTTIAYNAVVNAGAGGGLYIFSGSTGLYNTIVALNTGTNGVAVKANDIIGNVIAASANNLIGVGGSGGLTTGTNGNQVGVANPLLGPLAINGGSTATVALLSGSPAIGKGSSTIAGVAIPSTDQRGEARPSGSIDIGAYQTSAAAVVVGVVPSESTPTPATISVSVPTVHSSSATVVASPVSALPVAAPKLAKKVVGSKKGLPNGGSAGKFHKAAKAASGHRHASLTIKHASVRAKKR